MVKIPTTSKGRQIPSSTKREKAPEAKLKKAAHVEIPDDEKVEGWDERKKVDYERNKQFEKLTAKTVAMKEKMEKMQLFFCKA